MLTRRRGLLGGLTAGLAALVMPGPGRSAAASSGSSSQEGQGLDGTWVVDGNLLIQFTRDGGYRRSGADQPLESPGYGTWVRVGDREFDVTYMALRFDADHNFIGTRKANVRLRFNEAFDEFTGLGRGSVFDLDGNLIGSRQRALRGTRLQVERFA